MITTVDPEKHAANLAAYPELAPFKPSTADAYASLLNRIPETARPAWREKIARGTFSGVGGADLERKVFDGLVNAVKRQNALIRQQAKRKSWKQWLQEQASLPVPKQRSSKP